ncbi:hypothetical protein Ctha_2535 [Chloroherpeton thalassium ATCC 35110]|uniref:PorV/PorQ family protein n=1 Tax=Chloroherpeton thalassium (strain ATCC 35110 / GB-78) TaxID=517418 RepID=B3QXR9_CHLT3|nr:hypothetical protein [Chloroherpeton thalassium]ACF14984.1 hypothetical protein Ctha_2535 [Chloroherpeton thalassium ATCC 35110]
MIRKVLNHTIKTWLSGLVALFALCPSANAASENYTAAFLDIPLGVRALGLGGQYSPIDNYDGTAFYWNPAGVGLAKGKLLSTLYSNQFGSFNDPLTKYFYIGYTQDIGDGVGFSINWIRNSISDIPYAPDELDLTDIDDLLSRLESGDFLDGTFNNADDAIFVSIGKNIATSVDFGWQYFNLPISLPVGITFKYIHQGFSGNSAVEYSGTGVGIDVGGLLKFNLGDFVSNKSYGDVALGLTLRDIFNTPISWNTELKTKSSIKRSYLLSFSYKQPLPFISSSLMFVYSYSSKYDGLSSIGLEYKYRELLALRVGSYDSEASLGAGIFFNSSVFIDYAYNFNDLGGIHRVGVSLLLSRIL